MKTTWFFPRFFKETNLCKTNFGFCFEVLEFWVSCDGKNGITQLSMLNVIIFHELLECNLGMARVATFIYKFIHLLKLYSSMVMACASKASNKCEKTFQCVVCFVFVFFLMLTSSRSVQSVLCNRRCFAFHFTYMCLSFVHPLKSFIIVIIFHYPPPFLCFNYQGIFNFKHKHYCPSQT